jgi:hypothetical protein
MISSEYTVRENGRNDIASCDCCGNATITVWGHVEQSEDVVASYFVRWAVGQPDHGANFDLIVGRWGDGASSHDREAISVVYRNTPEGCGFMVVDAENSSAGQSELVGRALRREEVIGTELAETTFAMLDAIWLQDGRIDEVRHFWD